MCARDVRNTEPRTSKHAFPEAHWCPHCSRSLIGPRIKLLRDEFCVKHFSLLELVDEDEITRKYMCPFCGYSESTCYSSMLGER